MNNTNIFNCLKCNVNLNIENNRIVCKKCGSEYGQIIDGIIHFHGAEDIIGFFDQHATIQLEKKYAKYSHDDFLNSLQKKELYNMDLQNKKIGVTKKFWWEKHLGKIQNSSVLEVGCGVNYFVPYWLYSNNSVTAFDTCKESVYLLKKVLKKININKGQLDLFVGDAEQIYLNKKFDIININNVMHHIKNKKKSLLQLKELIKDDGKILIVEPNFYYPPRWIIETDFLNKLNFIKAYFQKNEIIEKGEKGIIFKDFKKLVQDVGLKIEKNYKDPNYLGYALTYFIDNNKFIPALLFNIDKYLLKHILPRVIAPFEYLILSKK